VTKAFLKHLRGQRLAQASLVRIHATVRHFARWLHRKFPDLFPLGCPTEGIKPPAEPEANWKGLTRLEELRLLNAAQTLRVRPGPGTKQGLRNHALLQCTMQMHDRFAEQRAKEELRRGPRGFKDQIDFWELLWSKYWLTEFFCDSYAVYTLGPAFAWSHLHLYMKMGGDAFVLPEGVRNITHPADDARMRVILEALRRSGFQKDAMEIKRRWQEALRPTTDTPTPDYIHCYPDALISFIVENSAEGVTDTECRLARPKTDDPVHLMLNEARRNFWTDPAGYHRWEADAVKELFTLCQDGVLGDLSAPR
jgi:hypothetical protein